MRKSALISLLLAAAFGIPASASTVYDINFSGTGTLPTAGSFTYNASTSTFSAFSVTWDGIDINLTGSANSPFTFSAGFPPCIGGLTGGAATFAMLSGVCDGAANESTAWSASADSGDARLQFLTVYNTLVGSDYPQLYILGDSPSAFDLRDSVAGTWTISAVTATPEPSMAMLLSIGLAALALVVRRRAGSQRRRI